MLKTTLIPIYHNFFYQSHKKICNIAFTQLNSKPNLKVFYNILYIQILIVQLYIINQLLLLIHTINMLAIAQRNQNCHHRNDFPSLNPQNCNETYYYSNQILGLHCPNYQSSNIQSPSNSKWKSQLCKRFIAETYCPYGQKCQFAHGVEELRCNSTQHGKYKTKSCSSWQKNGYCRFEARCNFLHEKYWHKIDYRKSSKVQDIEMMILMKQGIKKQSSLLRVLKE